VISAGRGREGPEPDILIGVDFNAISRSNTLGGKVSDVNYGIGQTDLCMA
jgi:hypothetical protein